MSLLNYFRVQLNIFLSIQEVLINVYEDYNKHIESFVENYCFFLIKKPEFTLEALVWFFIYYW